MNLVITHKQVFSLSPETDGPLVKAEGPGADKQKVRKARTP